MASRLATEIAGLKLANPIMLASGILGLSGLSLRRVVDAGAGAVITKSVGLKPREGYINPTVVQAECGLLNALGLPNPGVHYFIEEIRGADLRAPIVMSIYGFSSEDFAEVSNVAVRLGWTLWN
jgi:dihydroorotate dehydrogenase (NAD+) catalytic subunit